MAAQGVAQAMLSKFFSGGVEGFGHTVCIERNRIAGGKAAFADSTIPLFEKSENGAGGIESIEISVCVSVAVLAINSAKHQTWQMSAIDIAHVSRAVVIFREEERGISVVGGILVEQLIHGLQQLPRIIPHDRALAAQVRLEIGHEQSTSNSLPSDVAEHQADSILAEIEEVVIISSDLSSLDADACVIQGFERRKVLGKESRLHLHGNLKLVSGAALGFEFLRRSESLRFDRLRHLVEADQREDILIDVFEAGEHFPPDRFLLPQQQGRRRVTSRHCCRWRIRANAPQPRNLVEDNAASPPLNVERHDVFRDEGDSRWLADQLIRIRFGIRRDQRKHRRTVRWRDSHQTLSRLQAYVIGQIEPKLVEIESQALVQIANEDVDRMDAKIRHLPIERRGRLVHKAKRRGAGHGGYYKSARGSRSA